MITSQASRRIPNTWHAQAEKLWVAGDHQAALTLLLTDLNSHGQNKPTPRVLQLVYYFFERGDWAAAAGCLSLQHVTDPASDEVLLNLAACLSRAGRTAESVDRARDYVARHANEPMAWDVLCSGLQALGKPEEAAEAGTRSLVIKDRVSLAAHKSMAAGQRKGPGARAPLRRALNGTQPQQNVIAFSLWGDKARYLRGALDNLLAAPGLYPGWQVRIYLDGSVPHSWQALLVELGADLRHQPAGQPLRQRLCWRFQVANDRAVHRFLVRDIDSVLNARECAAVTAWLASDRRFHVMRDWWTHTDLMLAGMWGGTAGVLPDLTALVATYKSRVLDTPNVDQWFLRDRVWPLLHDDCLVHDRCFTPPGAQPWPEAPPADDQHVGQDEHAARRSAQEARLQPWLSRLQAS